MNITNNQLRKEGAMKCPMEQSHKPSSLLTWFRRWFSQKNSGGINRCGKLHSRPSDMVKNHPDWNDPGIQEFDMILRDMVIQWSLYLMDPDSVAALLRHYGRLASGSLLDEYGKLDSSQTSMFRQTLNQMIAERREQGDSHDL